MTTKDKIKEAYGDLDLMPFGKYKGRELQDIPASYLAWCWEQEWLQARWPKLHAYVHNSKEAIELELKRKI